MSEQARTLKVAVASVRGPMKRAGFEPAQWSFWRQRGVADYRVEEANVEVINVQMAKSGIEWTLNYGVMSSHILQAQGGSAVGRKREMAQCHWRSRIAREDGSELWLPVGTSEERIAAELMSRIEQDVLPDLQRHLSDEALLSVWLSGQGAGLTEPQRLLFAAILLKKLRQTERLRQMVMELRELVEGRPFGPRFVSDVHRLGLDEG